MRCIVDCRKLCKAGRLLLVTLLIGSVATGCTKTVITSSARLDRSESADVSTAPKNGAYKLQWTRKDKHDLHTVGWASRYLKKGERLGFMRDTDGGIIAVAGDEQFLVADVPDNVKYVVWNNKERKQTQFGREMRKAGEILTVVAMGAGMVAFGVGVLTLEAAAASDTNSR